MRIFIANGAPRDNGYTKDLLKLFSQGVLEAGAELDIADLYTFNLASCRGCYGCWTGNNAGKCAISDDMSDLLQRYLNSNLVVFATPLYFYSFSSRLKGFIERLLPITKPYPPAVSSIGLTHNSLRNPTLGPVSSALIAVAGHRDPRGMEGIVKTFTLISDSLKLNPVGKLLRGESFFLDFPAGKRKATGRAKAAFRKAGKELATLGRILEKTEKEASLPLTPSQDSFDRLTAKYWQTAEKTQGAVFDRKELRHIFSQDLNMLIPELAGSLNSAAAGDLCADFLFVLDGGQPGQWHLAVRNGECTALAKGFDNPTVTVRTSSETLLDIIFQRSDARELVARGKLKIAGDKALFRSFAKLFSSPLENDPL